MRRYIGFLSVFAVALLAGLGGTQERANSTPEQGSSEPDAGEAAFAPGRILVKLDDDVPADSIASVNRRNDARVKEKIPHSRVSVVDLPENLSVTEGIERYEDFPEVEYAEPDYKVYLADYPPTPNDPSFPKMYDLENRGQYGGTFDADIDAPEAWKATTGGTDTVVAIIDTGVDINHKDLRDNIWTNPGESGLDASGKNKATNGKDDDSNGYVDDVHGWDFRYENNSVFDGAGQDAHGTHVAGTIGAAGNNGAGVTGINWQAKVMPLKFIGADGEGYVSDAVEALNYALAEGVKVSNNSYGYEDDCDGCYARTLQKAIADADKKGHLFVTAAGNGGADDEGDDNDAVPFYPASYDNPNIISVAASNNEDELTSFSNYGAVSVDLAAPGKDILSTLPGDEYGYGYGTSMATPHVTGVGALLASKSPHLSDTGIKASILGSVDEKDSMESKLVTGGRLNAAKALRVNTAPAILGPRPAGKIRDRTPAIGATVRDDETELTQEQITLYLDGQPKEGISYDQTTDTLTYNSRKLARRTHSVRVVVTDGQELVESYTWKFRLPLRR